MELNQIYQGDTLQVLKTWPNDLVDTIITSPPYLTCFPICGISKYMTKKELLAYLAGLVDGEAYVGIKKSTWGMRNRPDVLSPTYHERIQIRMVDEPAIKLFKKTFGGNYYRETEHSKYSKRPLYCYQSSDLQASKILKALLPYLIIKKRQARLCLDLRQSKNSKEAKTRKRKMSQKVLDLRESLYLQIKQIHKGGDGCGGDA